MTWSILYSNVQLCSTKWTALSGRASFATIKPHVHMHVMQHQCAFPWSAARLSGVASSPPVLCHAVPPPCCALQDLHERAVYELGPAVEDAAMRGDKAALQALRHDVAAGIAAAERLAQHEDGDGKGEGKRGAGAAGSGSLRTAAGESGEARGAGSGWVRAAVYDLYSLQSTCCEVLAAIDAGGGGGGPLGSGAGAADDGGMRGSGPGGATGTDGGPDGAAAAAVGAPDPSLDPGQEIDLDYLEAAVARQQGVVGAVAPGSDLHVLLSVKRLSLEQRREVAARLRRCPGAAPGGEGAAGNGGGGGDGDAMGMCRDAVRRRYGGALAPEVEGALLQACARALEVTAL